VVVAALAAEEQLPLQDRKKSAGSFAEVAADSYHSLAEQVADPAAQKVHLAGSHKVDS
jgi:hypothetical protein